MIVICMYIICMYMCCIFLHACMKVGLILSQQGYRVCMYIRKLCPLITEEFSECGGGGGGL